MAFLNAWEMITKKAKLVVADIKLFLARNVLADLPGHILVTLII